jgi:hypothetical protein
MALEQLRVQTQRQPAVVVAQVQALFASLALPVLAAHMAAAVGLSASATRSLALETRLTA